MKLCIHRGTHQIGGIAAEISTASTRILIDMGDELSLDPNFVSAPLNIPGVTDGNGHCDAVLFTHYHGDHTGQMLRIRPEIPIYAGALAKDIMRLSAERGGQKNEALCKRIETMQSFSPGKLFLIGDIQITPFCIDHSACDSYMLLTANECCTPAISGCTACAAMSWTRFWTDALERSMWLSRRERRFLVLNMRP